MIRGTALLLALIAFACGGGIPVEEVPDAPIAFIRQHAANGILGLDEFRDAVRVENPEKRKTMRPRLKTTLSLIIVPTSEIREVPDAGFGALPFDWSRDGRRLLVGQGDPRSGLYKLLTWNRITGSWTRAARRLTNNGGGFGDGPIRLAWDSHGRDGETVFVSHDEDGEVALGVLGRFPDVSPDGTHVLLTRPVRQSAREPVIVSASADDPEGRILGRGEFPRYSRDGRWITYVRKRGDNKDIWMMRADGTARRALVATGFDEEFPALSPDGRYVVYQSVRSGEDQSQLFLTRLADGVELQLTYTGQNGRPVW